MTSPSTLSYPESHTEDRSEPLVPLWRIYLYILRPVPQPGVYLHLQSLSLSLLTLLGIYLNFKKEQEEGGAAF